MSEAPVLAPPAHRVRVTVISDDQLGQAAVSALLRTCPDVQLVSPDDASTQVVLLLAEAVTTEVVRRAAVQRGLGRAVVLVVTELDDAAVLAAVEGGVSTALRRREATWERLVLAVRAAAAGDGALPPDLLGRLLEQLGRLQRQVLAPRGLTFTGLTTREADVLRLVADGHDTAEVARRLSYSERTVKNVLHDITARYNLRNRCHAVAYAVREGLI